MPCDSKHPAWAPFAVYAHQSLVLHYKVLTGSPFDSKHPAQALCHVEIGLTILYKQYKKEETILPPLYSGQENYFAQY